METAPANLTNNNRSGYGRSLSSSDLASPRRALVASPHPHRALASSPSFSPAPAPAAPVVWTNAAKAPVAKKTMKEIQEEEEKRKKLAAKEKESMAAAARRAYAESTSKVRLGVRAVR